MDTQDAHAHLDDVLVTPEQIRSRIAEISREIEADYPDSTPLLVGVLKGAVMVMADLARELKIDVEMDCLGVKFDGYGTRIEMVTR